MQPARATWTDERLDDLSARVERGFEKVDRDIRELRMEMKSGDEALRKEMHAGFRELSGELNGRFGEIEGRFGEMNARFADLERTIRRFGGLMILTLAAALLEGRL
jgi:hypothetical protein